jgi:hypothetical protein
MERFLKGLLVVDFIFTETGSHLVYNEHRIRSGNNNCIACLLYSTLLTFFLIPLRGHTY